MCSINDILHLDSSAKENKAMNTNPHVCRDCGWDLNDTENGPRCGECLSRHLDDVNTTRESLWVQRSMDNDLPTFDRQQGHFAYEARQSDANPFDSYPDW